jgi:hypothetical protein
MIVSLIVAILAAHANANGRRVTKIDVSARKSMNNLTETAGGDE